MRLPSMRFVRSALAYLVPTFLVAFVWHLKLFEGFYDDLRIYRPDKIVPLGFLSMVVQGLVVAFVYPRLSSRPEAMSSGLKFASGAALLSWSFTTLAVAAKHPMTSIPRFTAAESAFTVIQWLLVAPFLALATRSKETGDGLR